MLAALRFQDPQQQGGQVRAEALVGTGRPQQCPQAAAHLAAGDLAAQQGVAAIEQPVADGGEEMVRAEQVGDAPLTAAGDRFGPRLAQIAHDCDRVAKGGHSALDSGAQFAFVLRSDAHRVQHPAGPAVQAAERAATALVTGGIDVQGIAVGQGGPQGRGAVPMQSLQGRQEAIAQRGDGTGRKGEALAGQSDPHDQVPAVALAGRGQAGQLLRDRDSPGGAVPALLADLARPQRAGRQGDQHAGLALLRAQGPAAVGTLVPLGDEIDTRGSPADERGTGDPVAGPARVAGLFQQQRQEAVDPPFSPIRWSSKRSNTAWTCPSGIGGERPCRRRATCPGREPGWRTSTSSTAMMIAGSSVPARSAAWRASRRVWRARRCRSAVGGSAEK